MQKMTGTKEQEGLKKSKEIAKLFSLPIQKNAQGEEVVYSHGVSLVLNEYQSLFVRHYGGACARVSPLNEHRDAYTCDLSDSINFKDGKESQAIFKDVTRRLIDKNAELYEKTKERIDQHNAYVKACNEKAAKLENLGFTIDKSYEKARLYHCSGYHGNNDRISIEVSTTSSRLIDVRHLPDALYWKILKLIAKEAGK